jgi:hypothetical protein
MAIRYAKSARKAFLGEQRDRLAPKFFTCSR